MEITLLKLEFGGIWFDLSLLEIELGQYLFRQDGTINPHFRIELRVGRLVYLKPYEIVVFDGCFFMVSLPPLGLRFWRAFDLLWIGGFITNIQDKKLAEELTAEFVTPVVHERHCCTTDGSCHGGTHISGECSPEYPCWRGKVHDPRW